MTSRCEEPVAAQGTLLSERRRRVVERHGSLGLLDECQPISTQHKSTLAGAISLISSKGGARFDAIVNCMQLSTRVEDGRVFSSKGTPYCDETAFRMCRLSVDINDVSKVSWRFWELWSYAVELCGLPALQGGECAPLTDGDSVHLNCMPLKHRRCAVAFHGTLELPSVDSSRVASTMACLAPCQIKMSTLKAWNEHTGLTPGLASCGIVSSPQSQSVFMPESGLR
jgi:hypothetical protein